MTRPRQLRRWATPARRLTGLGLAVVHLVAALGLPTPAPPTAHAGGSFPCRLKRCGCSTPAQSLGDGCCCSAKARKRTTPTQASHSCSTAPAGSFDRWAVAWQAAECRGHGPTGVISHPPAATPFEPVALPREAPRDVVPEPSSAPVTVPLRPPTPPPRPV